jgi:2-dehydro-3-deoxygluconokinase
MKTFAAFGEIMLRLSPPGRERIFQSPVLGATFGGAEANVAVSLARFGHPSRFVSVVPAGPIGDAALAELRKHGVNTDLVKRQGSRLGVYYAEPGAAQRPSLVIYDREHSGLAEAKDGDLDWARIMEGVDWFHTTGITPAISASAAGLVLEAVRAAKSRGLTVSLDLNYRAKLWRYGKSAPEVMAELMKFADLAVANEEDIQRSLGLKSDAAATGGTPDINAYERLAAQVMSRFPNVSRVAVTLRESLGADHNRWSAVLGTRQGFLVSKKYDILPVVDRIGSGDAFAAGLLHGLDVLGSDKEALELATAASCLKHSIPGDFNLAGEAEVQALLGGDASGRIQR